MPDRPLESRAAPAREEGGGLVVTESMARLYLRQGHKALALAVYRRLAAEAPGSEALRDAVRRLEADLPEAKPDRVAASTPEAMLVATPAGPTVAAWLAEILQAAPSGSGATTGQEIPS